MRFQARESTHLISRARILCSSNYRPVICGWPIQTKPATYELPWADGGLTRRGPVLTVKSRTVHAR
jgi:hypothetical protein